MKRLLFLFVVWMIIFPVCSQTNSITNLTVAQRTNGEGLVDITYDLAGNQATYTVVVDINFNTNIYWQQIFEVTGDVGDSVTPGTGKAIVWDFATEFPDSVWSDLKVRVFAANVNLPFTCGDILLDDRDGQTYHTTLIGTQCWMANNLNYGVKVDPFTYEQSQNGIIEKYCYNGLSSNCTGKLATIWGGLYNWYELFDIESGQGICPDGWHVPDSTELDIMLVSLGGISVAGGKLKTVNNKEFSGGWWYAPNTGATNESGFSYQPAGQWLISYGFPNPPPPHYIDSWAYGFLWTNTAGSNSNDYGWLMEVRFNSNEAFLFYHKRRRAYSVRCVKD